MDNRPSLEALEAVHPFPGEYQIKVIGNADADFPSRVVAAAISELAGPGELDYTIRSTPSGRHVSLTLDITVQSAEQVRNIYARIHEVEGLTIVF